jgi:hypothetical protein
LRIKVQRLGASSRRYRALWTHVLQPQLCPLSRPFGAIFFSSTSSAKPRLLPPHGHGSRSSCGPVYPWRAQLVTSWAQHSHERPNCRRSTSSGAGSHLAVAPGGAVVFAATANGGVFRSGDGGTTWRSMMDRFDLDPTFRDGKLGLRSDSARSR